MMPEANSNRTTTLRPRRTLTLAKTAADWAELDAEIRHTVANLTQTAENAQGLLRLIDLMTNERYDALHRSLIIDEIQERAFHYTREYEAALNSYIAGISAKKPERQIKAG